MNSLSEWLKKTFGNSVLTLVISSLVAGYAILASTVLFLEGFILTAIALSVLGSSALAAASVVALNLANLVETLHAMPSLVVAPPAPTPENAAVSEPSPRTEVKREPLGMKDHPPMTLRPERLRLLQPAEQPTEPADASLDRKSIRLVA